MHLLHPPRPDTLSEAFELIFNYFGRQQVPYNMFCGTGHRSSEEGLVRVVRLAAVLGAKPPACDHELGLLH